MAEDQEFQKRIRKIEDLIQTIEESAEQAARANAKELVHAILELHGVGLMKILEIVNQSGNPRIVDSLARDDLVGCLLLLHGIHPLDQAIRIEQALEKVRPRLFVHGGRLELLDLDKNVLRIRLHATRDGSPADAASFQLRQWIEEAICAAAPEITTIEFAETAQPAAWLISLPMVADGVTRGRS
jgi:Fe-S cluster biogenesis protein NfuA